MVSSRDTSPRTKQGIGTTDKRPRPSSAWPNHFRRRIVQQFSRSARPFPRLLCTFFRDSVTCGPLTVSPCRDFVPQQDAIRYIKQGAFSPVLREVMRPHHPQTTYYRSILIGDMETGSPGAQSPDKERSFPPVCEAQGTPERRVEYVLFSQNH